MDNTPIRSDDKVQPEKTPTEGNSRASRPANWDRHQMETDDAGEPREQDAETLPRWNKGEIAEERADHTRSPLTPPEELDAPDDGLSGHGSNPGGGERWAKREPQK